MRDDGEDRIIEHLSPMDRFVVSHIALAFLLDDRCGKSQFYLSIEHASFVVRLLTRIVALEGGNFIAKELCLLRSPMRNERLRFGKFQLEVFFEKLPNLAFDFLCILFGAIC